MCKSGIYQIKNIINNKIYIGSAINILQRWSVHQSLLNSNKHYNNHLQSAWNKYGKANFVFEIVEVVEAREELVKREQVYIDFMLPEYNISKIAGNTLGIKFTEESRKKISDSLKGRFTQEKNPFYGKKHSQESKNKMSKSRIGRALSKEWRENLSKSNIGKKLSQETRNKISQSQCGEKSNSAKLTWQQVKEIRELYKTDNSGISQASLAKCYNVSKGTIQDVLENRTWKIENYNRKNKKNIKRLTYDKAEEIREQYKNGNITYKMLAQKYEVSKRTIQNIIKNKTWIKKDEM